MNDAKMYLELIQTDGVAAASAGLESLSAGGTEPVRSDLLERLRSEIAYVEHVADVSIDSAAIDRVVDKADEGLRLLLGDGVDADLQPETAAGLEAVVRTDGSRPVLFVIDDFVDLQAPSIGDYAAVLSRQQEAVRAVCRSVGRVDDPAAPLQYQGTAWAIDEGLVVTNYHVLEAIAPGCTRDGGHFEGRLNNGVAVHFGHEVKDQLPDRRFPIRRVRSVGHPGAPQHAHPDIEHVNFDGLDLAVLELEPVPNRPFPPPITVARGDDPLTHGGRASAGTGVYVVGYPGNRHSTTADLLASLFHNVVSYKRLAPGQIMRAAGTVEHDPRGWVITHDASTLGGNSGSAVVDLNVDGSTLLGLHFAGHHGRRNWAHATERITDAIQPVLPPGP